MAESIAHMVEMGLETSVVAPLAVVIAQRHVDCDRIALPAIVALPLFLVSHAAITLTITWTEPPLLEHLALHAALFVVAVVFWLPVLGRHRRLSDPGRVLYLFMAAPSMDLAAVFIVLRGDGVDGIAMIVAMLPVGVITLAVAWRWMVQEERQVAQREPAPDLGPVSTLDPVSTTLVHQPQTARSAAYAGARMPRREDDRQALASRAHRTDPS